MNSSYTRFDHNSGDTPPVLGRLVKRFDHQISISKYSVSGKAINLLHETWLK